ncbi:Glutathione S-transferase F3, partial [Tetrabaena socialis]
MMLQAPALKAAPACRSRAAARRPVVRVSAGIQLYSNPASRGRICEWYINEIGAVKDVEIINLEMREKREHKSEAFLKINPYGKLPALVDGDLKI